ncbi:MAG TPA: LuxR C-terminal-related transcriptional regulator [Chloroflexota bacterium]|jgi:LuxR family maltose regulon positive regulatory protein
MLDDGVPHRARRPRVPSDIVPRPRLTARILDGITGPLTLVCAPAGFGKTIALATALEESHWPVAWLTLDAAASSLLWFVRAFVAALQQHYPDAGRSTLTLLQLPRLPLPPAIAQVLAEDLDSLPDDCLVVLDDYQTITSAEVDALLVALLRALPPQVHLVVASRTPPDWPLASLRAAGLLTEVDGEDLRFTSSETRAFLRRATRAQVDETTSAAVHEQMGGWGAAVRLAALALRHVTGTPEALPSLARRAEPQVVQYLYEEIVAKQPRPVTEFLVRTAVCDRITPALGDALLAEEDRAPDSAAMLQQLERAGLFVTRERGDGDWYRYHDLMRAALVRGLREQRDGAHIRALHVRASAWFAQEGRVPEAVRHALAADERDRAAEIVEARIPGALEQHQWALVAGWLDLLPPELVDERPALLLAAGWVAHRRMQYGRLTAILERVTAWLDHHAPRLPPHRVQAIEAEIDALSATTGAYTADYQHAYDRACRAWERLPGSAAHARGQAGCTLGIAAQILGHSEVAARLLESDQGLGLRQHPAATLHLWLAVLNTQFADGELTAAEQTGSYIAHRAAELGLGFVGAWAHYLLGRVRYEWDDLTTAAEHYRAVIELRNSAAAFALRGSLQGLALTNLALGQAPRAGLENGTWRSPVTEAAWRVDEEVARAFEARLALIQGDREAALAWLHGTPPQPGSELNNSLEVAAITRVEVLLAAGLPAALATAAGEVAQLLVDYTARHDTIHVLPLLLLQARVADAQGDGARALAALERAVGLGLPGGFLRTFADQGPAVARLLARLPPRDDTREYLDRLRAACGPPRDRRAAPVPHREAMWAELTEPLTAREQEVLDLLAGRLSNKEIANRLCVSWQTVAKHTANIYQKLRVTGRRDAVARATALGILSTSDDAVDGA